MNTLRQPFFTTLNYSSCNEDWRTELAALQLGPQDSVFCITGSGDRPLHLLLGDPARVVAADANPTQGYLLQLKRAALRSLPHGQYVGLLGLCHQRARWQQFVQLRDEMDDDAWCYWSENRALVERGVLYAGRWERYYRQVSRLARTMRPLAIAQLFAFDELEAQRRYVQRTWDRRWWRLIYDALCHPAFSRIALRDPAFYRHVDPSFRVGRYIYNGMTRYLERELARNSFMLSLVLRGRLSDFDLPPYLEEESAHTMRARLHRMQVTTGLADVLLRAANPGTFSRFSMSDVPSYLSPGEFERLLDAMVHAAAPGARFCIRQFLTTHRIPPRFDTVLRREPELEKQLQQVDRAFAYRFLVGTIHAASTDRRPAAEALS